MDPQPRRYVSSAIIFLYLFITGAFFLQLWLIHKSPNYALDYFFQLGPITEKTPLFFGVGWVWLLAGILLVALNRQIINRENVFAYSGFFLIGLIYANILRERVNYGDYQDYIIAASNFAAGEPFGERYVYPPLLAVLLSFFWNVGGWPLAESFCFGINMLSLSAFFSLALLFLKRAHVSANLAGLLLFFAMVVNVPIMRNLVYVQVNLLVADLILGALLFFPRHYIASAACLAVGVQLKVIPLVFIPAFCKIRNIRWLIAFTIFNCVIVGLTSINGNFRYYTYFWSNLKTWNFIDLESVSVHSLLAFHGYYFPLLKEDLITIATILRISLVAFCLFLAYQAGARSTFFKRTDGSDAGTWTLNASVPLFFLPFFIQGTVWAHHLVLLIIPCIFLALALPDRKQIVLFGAFYLLVFLVPSFDMYPWAFLRVIGYLGFLFMLGFAIMFRWNSCWATTAERKIDTLLLADSCISDPVSSHDG